MTTFEIHTPETVTDSAAATLNSVQSNIGFIPNVFATIAESPAALTGFVNLGEAFASSTFTSEEQQVIQLAVSTENECVYCVSGHTAFAQTLNIPESVVSALRAKKPLPDERLNALSNLVRSLVQHRGHIERKEIESYLAAGFTRAQFMEVILGISLKTFSNYASIALNIKLDKEFESYAWQPSAEPKDAAA
jgi:uncharacterized peroxidase-related enzyme